MDASTPGSSAKKKRILHVERQYSEGSPEKLLTSVVADVLGREYDLDRHTHLDSRIVTVVKNAMQAHPYDALITHVPDSPKTSFGAFADLIRYADSLGVISEIKKIADIPIVAYTGAGFESSCFFYDSGVDEVVPKSDDIKRDLDRLRSALERLLKHYRPGEPEVPLPKISRGNGYTTTEATVMLISGLGFWAFGAMLRRCKEYPGAVLVSKCGGSDPNGCNLRDVMKVLTLEIANGTRLRLKVQGEGAEAEKLARQLYSGLSSKYADFMNFDRFSNPK